MRRSTFVAGSAAAAFTLAGARAASALEALTIATIPSDISAEAWYGTDSGIFKKAGFDVKVVPIANGGAIAAAVAGGAADVGYSNVISLANAHAKGLPFTILAPANLHVHNAPTAGILAVKKTAGIATGKDLEGKTVAVVGLGNIADIAARAWIDKNGGDSKTAKFLELPFPQMSDALIAGRIDAASLDATADPTLGKPDDPLKRIGVTFDAVALSFAPSVWFTTTDWIAKNPARAKAFVAAMRETAAWSNAHHAETAAILAKYTPRSVEVIESVVRTTYGDRMTPELIQPNIDVAARYGVIKSAFPAAEMIAVVG